MRAQRWPDPRGVPFPNNTQIRRWLGICRRFKVLISSTPGSRNCWGVTQPFLKAIGP